MVAGEFPRVSAALAARRAASRVPEVTVYFWIIKVLTTGTGEAMSDYLVRTINPFVAVGLGGVALVISLALQAFARRYVTWIYWLAVLMVAVFGTMVADVLHVVVGVSYAAATAGFAITLALVFGCWYATERTLSVHSIRTRRREVFYWATVMATFALGTAAGDLTATTLHLGFFASGVLFAAAIAVPGIAHRWLGLDAVAAFWSAYVLTRPLGASFADWLGVPHGWGGLGLGRGPVSLAGLVLIAGFVGYLMVTRRDVPARPAAPGGPPKAGRHRATGPRRAVRDRHDAGRVAHNVSYETD